MKRTILYVATPLLAAFVLTGCEKVIVNRLEQPDVLTGGSKINPVIPLTARQKRQIAAEKEAQALAAAEAKDRVQELPTDPTDAPVPAADNNSPL